MTSPTSSIQAASKKKGVKAKIIICENKTEIKKN
jgi:hypothetical protein